MSMAERGDRACDQHEIWRDVERKSETLLCARVASITLMPRWRTNGMRISSKGQFTGPRYHRPLIRKRCPPSKTRRPRPPVGAPALPALRAGGYRRTGAGRRREARVSASNPRTSNAKVPGIGTAPGGGGVTWAAEIPLTLNALV